MSGDPLLGENAQRRFLPTRFNVHGNAFDAAGHICHELACPHCHLKLPRMMLEMPPLFFSIIGTPSSGKSYYLASLTWQLRQSMPKHFALAFTDGDPDANRILNQYEEIQFCNPNPDELVKLAKTQVTGDLYDSVKKGDHWVNYPRPFMFAIRPLEHHPSNKLANHVARTLCLYDNAGESFAPGTDTHANPVTQHLSHAQALFFVFDPTQDTRFRESCQGISSDPQILSPKVTSRQETTFHEMALRIRRHANIPQQMKCKKPVIIIVTKYDAWSGLLPDVTLRDPWIKTSKDNLCALDNKYIEEVSKQVRALLYQKTPELVASAEGFSERVLYIPVSATGEPPELDSNTGNYGFRPKSLAPTWVEVPMLWTLAVYGQGLIPYKR